MNKTITEKESEVRLGGLVPTLPVTFAVYCM